MYVCIFSQLCACMYVSHRLEAFKNKIISIPLYKNAFEVVVILFGPWSLETWDNNILLSIICKYMQISKHSCMYYTLYKSE